MGMFDYFVWPSAGILDGQTKDLPQDLDYYHLIEGRLWRGGRVEVSEMPMPDAPLERVDYSRDIEVIYGFDDDLKTVTVSFYQGSIIDCSDLSMLSAAELAVCRESQMARLADFEQRIATGHIDPRR